MRILVMNAGSSSLKGALWDVEGGPAPPQAPSEPLWTARVDWGRHPGSADVVIRARGAAEDKRAIAIESPRDAFGPVLDALPAGAIDVVGHRIVHGGARFSDSVRIEKEVRNQLAELAEFAPEHNQIEVAVIDAVTQHFGTSLTQIAVFDTSFHATMPEAAYVYPGPRDWLDSGIRRYGFHGISYSYTSRRAAAILKRDLASLKMVACHLGNGCSVCAIDGGRSVDTSMGFTPLEGLMMGTRSGSIDPGICIYLIRHRGYSAGDLDRVLNKESGLKGISGVSADMREIVAAREAGDRWATLAYDIFVHRLSSGVGAMAAILGGMDALVFTAGIGENCAPLRESVCERLAFLGTRLDRPANEGSPVDRDIAVPDSRIRVLVVATDEDWEIARECVRMRG